MQRDVFGILFASRVPSLYHSRFARFLLPPVAFPLFTPTVFSIFPFFLGFTSFPYLLFLLLLVIKLLFPFYFGLLCYPISLFRFFFPFILRCFFPLALSCFYHFILLQHFVPLFFSISSFFSSPFHRKRISLFASWNFISPIRISYSYYYHSPFSCYFLRLFFFIRPPSRPFPLHFEINFLCHQF